MIYRLIYEKLIEAVFALFVSFFPALISSFPTEESVSDELQKLRNRAKRIRARLDDAEQNRRIEDESVLLWLSELRSIAFDAEDLNEEFEIRTQVTPASHWAMLSSARYCRCVRARIGEINKRYDEIYEDRKAQMLHESDQARPVSRRISDTRQTGSMEGTCRVHGRHDESRELIRLLIEPMNNRRFPPVVSIIGEGGMGKTALAQLAFNCPDITNHFEQLIWISPSPNTGPVEIIKKIIEAIRKTNCNLSALDALQCRLRQLVSGKRFLLVLDGVYTEDPFVWDPVWTPLNAANSRSKVLVTTRSRVTAQYMGSMNSVSLTGLNSSALWLVLNNEAFLQASTPESVPENLKSIGKKIAAKCYGSPLAAKLLGRNLCGVTDEEKWDGLLQDMPDPREVVDNILPSLRLSYELLPLHLKRCFAYCAIFPKGHEFDRDTLVNLWVSEGLLEPDRPREGKTLEDIGRKQFTNLLSRSFFEPCGHNRYVMPGAIHDLAQSVSLYICARVDQSGIQHGQLTMTRYASLCGDHLKPESMKHICDRKHLRTLIVYSVGCVPITCHLQHKLLSNLSFLRSLDLSNCKFDNLHKCIGNLIHLRYLNLCGSLFKILPDSICKLLKLQTLNLDGCYNLKNLPNGMSSMIKMRHIYLNLNWEKWDGEDLDSMPPRLGTLTSLQTLSRFVVGKKDGCGITELKDLNIRGELCISKLENVNNGNEARVASLCRKQHLKYLMLRWSSRKSFSSANEEEVIAQLEPSVAIKSIWIEGYSGSEFPRWITNTSFRYLETLKLLNCKVCTNLPQVARLPQLKRLYLVGLYKVKDLNQLLYQSDSVGFPSLELLHLSDMPEFEKWFSVTNVSLPELSELFISDCPKLKEISYLPSSITRFQLRNCTSLMGPLCTVPSLSNLIVEGVDSKIIWWIQKLTSLTSLSLIKIQELKHINCENLSRLSSLTTLKIKGCKELESIAQNGDLEYHPPLKKLNISNCRKLQILFNQGLPCQMEELHLRSLESLSSLPSGLDGLRELHTLEIHDVPMLPYVPKMPSSLRLLHINGCQDLEKRCTEGGPDWSNVSGVGCLFIGETQLR